MDFESDMVVFRDSEKWWLGTDGRTMVEVKYLCEDFGTWENPKITVSARIKVPEELKTRYNGDKRVDDCGNTRWLELRVTNEGTDQTNVIKFTFWGAYEAVKEELETMVGMLHI
jgi:hypothetical protein